MRLRRGFVFVSLVLFLGVAHASPTLAANVLASAGDVSIAHDLSSNNWILQAGESTLTLAIAPAGDFRLVSLTSGAGRPWIVGSGADSTVTINGTALAFGSRQAGFLFRGAFTTAHDQTVQLDVAYDLSNSPLRIIRHYTMTSGSPAFETWSTFSSLGNPVSVSDLNAIQLTVPNGAIRHLTGLRGDNADVDNESAFTLRTRTLNDGEQLTLGAQGRSSERSVPWFAVDGSGDEFYAGLMWSGSWSLTINRASNGSTIWLGLNSMTTAVTDRVDGPHAVFGVVQGGLPDATAALRSYAIQGIRAGRGFTPLVTYNTWFSYGTNVNERNMESEMDRAASVGAELFVVDAGWYVGTGKAGVFDFSSGLGSWQVDTGRFPNGLRAVTDHAHGLGMKFGIWVEPEHVDRSILSDSGIQEAWLATSGGNYGSDVTAQICFANPVARQYIIDRLSQLIDSAAPDYLKWDNNSWINCDRAGHGHGAGDGNFAHNSGLYNVLSTLRHRYPNLLIENVSGGGNRLDLGMLRFTDVAWMDDRTGPSVHVRHNVEGLSAVFPPAYLLSFVTDDDAERLHNAADMPLYFRSRMAGALGLSYLSASLSGSDLEAMGREIGIYKTMRDTLATAAAALLTRQASAANPPDWDVLQEAVVDNTQLLIYAFQSEEAVDHLSVKPTGLQPDADYQVVSVDTGELGTAKGADLMSGGIDVLESPASAAHILMIQLKQ